MKTSNDILEEHFKRVNPEKDFYIMKTEQPEQYEAMIMAMEEYAHQQILLNKALVIKSLPSEEEINKEMMSSYKLGFGEKLTREKQSARYGFISGAKWMKEELNKRGNVL